MSDTVSSGRQPRPAEIRLVPRPGQPRSDRKVAQPTATSADGLLEPVTVRPVPAVAPGAAGEATVTVVIPCFNYARFLPAAVASALAQTGVAVDVVIVDDASTDDSAAVARGLAASDDRVSVVVHRANSGPVATFNDGLAVATGEFLVRLDADDLLTPGSLGRAIAVMRRFPSVGLVYGHPLHFAGDRLPRPRIAPTQWTVWPGRRWLADRCRSGLNVITSPEVLMRRSVVAHVGGQQPLAHTHDMEMWLRLAAFSDVAYIHGADQAWHRDHAASLSAREVDSFRDLVERQAAFETLFAGIAGAISEAPAMKESAMAALAAGALELACRQYDHRRPDEARVAALRAMAEALVEDARTLAGWRGLERRAAVGPGRTPFHPRFFVERALRAAHHAFRRRRWHKAGI